MTASFRRGESDGDWLHTESYADVPSQNTCVRWETADLLTLLVREDDEWMSEGYCHDQELLAFWEMGPDDWMEPTGGSMGGFNRRAIEICNCCPVQKRCAEWAITREEEYGIWGGMTPYARSRERGKREREARKAREAA